MNHSVACILMASGTSLRFGTKNKLFYNFRNKMLIIHALEMLNTTNLGAKICVTRYKKIEHIAKKQNFTTLLHNLPQKSDTIKIGVTYIVELQKNTPISGLMFCTADQPLLKKQTVNTLIATFNTNPECIVQVQNKKPPFNVGNPVIFPKHLFTEFLNLTSEQQGRTIIQNHKKSLITVPCAENYELQDIDTIEDSKKLETI